MNNDQLQREVFKQKEDQLRNKRKIALLKKKQSSLDRNRELVDIQRKINDLHKS